MSIAHPEPAILKVGTRPTPLALIQTRAFLAALAASGELPVPFAAAEEHVIRTTGDVVQDRSLAEIGGKGLFAKEIHEALLDRRIDLAVHSLKDLETTLPDGIVLGCTMRREDARDTLILPETAAAPDADDPWRALPRGATIGTNSVRRQSQLLHARPDLRIANLRGSVGTRLGKLAAGTCDATLLAFAGLRRLGMAERASVVLDPATMLPSSCQGIVGVTVRAGDTAMQALLAQIEDAAARAAAEAERAFLAALDGSCRTPIGAHATLLPDGMLFLAGLVARGDGSFLLRRSLAGPVADAARIGTELGAGVRADSPADLFA